MAALSAVRNAAAYCKKLTQRSQSNFYYAFLFLPRVRREALEAVYAFCRLVDDVVDEPAERDEKLAGLAEWRRQVGLVFENGPEAELHPVSAKLKDAIASFAIRREDLEAVIDGCQMDLDQHRYETWEDLRLYCYRVASAVGLMCIEIFGYSTPQARQYAIDLGIALQLTNILRDVGEDAGRGRIYLPMEDLRDAEVTESDLVAGKRSPGFSRLMRKNAARARAHYLRARAQLSSSERKKLVIAEIMGDIYFALLERLEAAQFDVFGDKISVGRRHKMAIALRNVALSKLML